jgi:thiol-disulfide isomerase/thioredoxin
MIVEVSARNFILQNIDTESLNLGNAKVIFLLVKATWCIHCTNYLPQYEEYSIQFPKAHFLVFEATIQENDTLLQQWAGLAYPIVPTSAGSMDVSEPGKLPFFNQEKTLRFPTVVIYSGSGVPIKVVKNRYDLASEIANLNLCGTNFVQASSDQICV